MKSNFRLPAFFTAALAAFAGPASGQDALPPSTINLAQRPTTSAPTVSIDFAGGSVADFLAVLKKNGTNFNLLANPEDLATPLPAFSIRNTLPTQFARALSQLISSRGFSIEQSGSGPIGLDPVFVLVRQSPTARVSFESFQMEPYLQKQSIQDIIDAIRLAWSMNPAHRPDDLQLKFHPATKLLLVAGPSEAIQQAKQIVSSLNPPPRSVLPAAVLRPEQEQRRLEAVAQEVSRRRELREQGKQAAGSEQSEDARLRPTPIPSSEKE
jgi:hypothetical protein